MLLLLAVSGCRRATPPKPRAPEFNVYRFDDNLESSATISAPAVASVARVADPIVWKDFLKAEDVTWNLLRGRMGIRQGDLVVKGEGSTPVIVSPNEPVIDWGLYEAVRIRMIAEGGAEIKLKIGPEEFNQKLAPPDEFKVYTFPVHIEAPRGSRPLAIMPTDHLYAPVAIDFIELVPRKATFQAAAGKQVIGKQDEYRNAIYAHSPSSITYEVRVPERGILIVGIGVAEKGKPVSFRVLAGAERKVLFSQTLDDPDIWTDKTVDLSGYAGRSTKIVFETSASQTGAVGLWANPLLTSRAPKPRPNVLIYLVCSLRPDHTSVYGYSRDTTPFMKQLASSGVVFDDAQAQAPWTKASVPSLMTSLYSYTHGLRNDNDTIPQGSTTIAEQLRAAGYVTASIVTNPFVGRVSALNRGFDYMMEYPVVHRQRTDEFDRGTDSAALNKVAMPWLEQHRDEPFFLYLHTTDPHAPYRPPKGFEEKYADPAESDKFNQHYRALLDKRQYGGGAVFTRETVRARGLDPGRFLQQAIDRYDGEVAFCDNSFGQLVKKLKDLGTLDNTLIVVVSDHGEEFWDHGFTAHGHSLYHELLHTLLFFWNPKLLPAPRRVSDRVQLIDVSPTVLELTGVQPRGIIQGTGLVPLLKGEALTRKAPVMSSKLPHPMARPDGFIPENRTGAFAIWEGDWKMIYRDQAKLARVKEVELYDSRKDPAEKNDVAAANSEIVQRLRTEVTKWIGAQKEVRKLLGPGGKSKLDPQSIERLRSLGYIGGKTGK